MTRDLASARDELVRAERVAAWREIAQRIAHEIKNPLTPIQMAIETLQRAHRKSAPQFDALFGESAQTILDEVGAAQAHRARVLLVRAHAGADARVRRRLARSSTARSRSTRAARPPLELDARRATCRRALADREQLTQVVINLVENARDAVGGKGRIRVATRAVDGVVELEVADDGPGLSDEARAKLFTPYFTTKTARHRPRPRHRAPHRHRPRRRDPRRWRARRRRRLHRHAAARRRQA